MEQKTTKIKRFTNRTVDVISKDGTIKRTNQSTVTVHEVENFYKIYYEDDYFLDSFSSLLEFKIFKTIVRYLDYNNSTITIDSEIKQQIIKTLGITINTLYNKIHLLKKNFILLPITNVRFYLNPVLVWRGNEQERKRFIRIVAAHVQDKLITKKNAERVVEILKSKFN